MEEVKENFHMQTTVKLTFQMLHSKQKQIIASKNVLIKNAIVFHKSLTKMRAVINMLTLQIFMYKVLYFMSLLNMNIFLHYHVINIFNITED